MSILLDSSRHGSGTFPTGGRGGVGRGRLKIHSYIHTRSVGRGIIPTLCRSRGAKNDSNGFHSPGNKMHDIDINGTFRVFSNVEVSYDDGRLVHTPGSVLGGAVLCAGTAVGAGILALPQSLSPAGLVPAAGAITGAAIFSILTGLCVAETAVNTMCELGTGSGVSLGSMARRTLGAGGAVAVKLTYTLLHYTLLVAYTAKAGETMSHVVPWSDVGVWDVLFTGAMGGLCYASSPKQLDAVNGILVSGVIISFLLLLVSVSSGPKEPLMELLSTDHWDVIPSTLPVVALSFVFQNVVPVICSSLEGDRSKIRTAIISGITVPWVMFMIWTGVILASSGTMVDGDPLQTVRTQSQTNALLIDGFSLLAVSTSYIGFVLGLKEFLLESLSLNPQKGGNRVVFPLVLLPPLGFALCFPDLFFSALEFAGTYGVLVLFGIIPVAMVWRERELLDERMDELPVEFQQQGTQLVPGGNGMLIILFLIASGIIVDQIGISLLS